MENGKDAVAVRAEVLEPQDGSTLVALQRAEVDQAIATAKAFPRDVAKFRKDLVAMATVDEETATSMFYSLPRGTDEETGAQKFITGESVRLAEMAGTCWGNVRYGGLVVEVGEDYLSARGFCFDLEKNVSASIDVRRRIINKYGKRYNADMIQVTAMAAVAIAIRNAIFKVVPKVYLRPVLDVCRSAVAGAAAKDRKARAEAALVYFEKLGTERAQVLLLLGVKAVDEITADHLATLTGIRTALKDGETTRDAVFPKTAAPTPTPVLAVPVTEAPKAETPKVEPQKEGLAAKANALFGDEE